MMGDAIAICSIVYADKNYTVRFTDHPVFANISVTAVGEQYVVLSKCADPVIHFVIRHPKLTAAIRAFRPPVE